jgi:hypothetical protein
VKQGFICQIGNVYPALCQQDAGDVLELQLITVKDAKTDFTYKMELASNVHRVARVVKIV